MERQQAEAASRAAELAREKEALHEERAKLVEELGVLRAEKRGADDLAKREREQVGEASGGGGMAPWWALACASERR